MPRIDDEAAVLNTGKELSSLLIETSVGSLVVSDIK